jgi:predicted ribosome quality control (RQC) complex YloA/Tae2 family protein
MDRLFLVGWVRESLPLLRGRRAREVRRWGEAGFFIRLGGRPRLDLVVSLFPEAPGLFLAEPGGELLDEAGPLARFEKLLRGAEVVEVEPAVRDRVLTLRFRRTKASGAQSRIELVLEWAASRPAAFLLDPEERRVLDVFSQTPPRQVAGETFHPLTPPPGTLSPPESGRDFAGRVANQRAQGQTESAAIRAASGLTPMLAAELERLHSPEGLSLAAAFDEMARRLSQEPRPTLLERPGASDAGGPWARLSPIDVEPPTGWRKRVFTDFNTAACAYVSEIGSLSVARRRRQLKRVVARQVGKTRALLERLRREEAELPDSQDLRRMGEALLAGVRQAAPCEGGVRVPDPYSPDGSLIRVPLDPRFDLLENAERYFLRGRKVGRSLERLAARREALRVRVDHLETLEVGVDQARALEELQLLAEELREAGVPVGALAGSRVAERRTSRPRPGKSARLGPLRFRGSRGGFILVGRSARSNEELTFRLAKPNELWFHAAATPGAHVLLRQEGRGAASPEEIEEAAAAAAFFSKARGATAAEVVYTERKHVRKLPGAPPGTVRLAEFRSIRVRPREPSSEDERENAP